VTLYERVLRPILFSLDPEEAHNFAIAVLRLLSEMPWLLGHISRNHAQKSGKELFGLHFPNPVGLAAGLDKNGLALPAWAAIGFGFVEIGTVTSLAQTGNPRPRIFRLQDSEALINRLGFNNEGADKIAARLKMLRASPRWPRIPVGINIGKSKVVPLEQAAADYIRSFDRLHALGDYFVLNVSSPNTPELRKLQEKGAIEKLFSAIRENKYGKPLLVKMAPDLTFEQMDHVLASAEAFELAGVIATNTTTDHSAIPADRRQTGGLSGRPLRTRSMQILAYIKRHSRLPVISVGGIMSAEDAKARFDEGADLVQIYTGLIYRGPALVRQISSLFRAAPPEFRL
jgi:dihydroorotate dehydrogenase